MQCSAQHQAVRHHTISTDGAARHAGCSGQMRPCVTARRRRQGSVGQVRECTGPAMPQHTYTQRAHNTHSPARLPLPVGRHPGLCLLVTAPSAHHTTPHHTTPHHTGSRALCLRTQRRRSSGAGLRKPPRIEETVYHKGYAVKVSTAMKAAREAERWAPELWVRCQPPNAMPSDTRLHRLLVALLDV